MNYFRLSCVQNLNDKPLDNNIFYVSLETGFPKTEIELKKDYNITNSSKCNIPITSYAIGMVGIGIKTALQWGNKYRPPHIDEIECAFFGKYFVKNNNNTYFIAKNETEKFGFIHSGYMFSIFSELKTDLEYYYKNTLKIIFNNEIYQALYDLAIKKYVYDDKEIKLSKVVNVGVCACCGENVFSYSFGMLSHAGILTMSFGYGSMRDLDYNIFLVHDHCSIKLQKCFKGFLYCNAVESEYTQKTGRLKLKPEKFEKSYKKTLKEIEHDRNSSN